LEGLELLRGGIVWYISTIPTWRQDIDNLLSNTQVTLRGIHEYLLTFSTWRLCLNCSPVYYLILSWILELYIHPQLYITDISITPYTWLFFVTSSTQVVDWEESKKILESPKEVQEASPIMWWWLKGFLCYNTLLSALFLLMRQTYFAVSY
jgi:hypothetical protein